MFAGQNIFKIAFRKRRREKKTFCNLNNVYVISEKKLDALTFFLVIFGEISLELSCCFVLI